MNYKCLSINIANAANAMGAERYGFKKVSFEEYRKCFPENEFTEDQIQKIYENIQLPRRMTSNSCGYDFFMPYTITLEPMIDPKKNSIMIPTGIRCKLPPCVALLIYPRSSLGCEYGIRLANTVGVIDPDYYGAKNEGHIFVKLTAGNTIHETIYAGERFCQGVLTPFATIPDYDAQFEESATQRTGGLGSTSKQNR